MTMSKTGQYVYYKDSVVGNRTYSATVWKNVYQLLSDFAKAKTEMSVSKCVIY